MIGFFDYSMYLTYLSLVSGVMGILISTYGTGHPYLGMFFLLFCGLCDTFDGMVARTKKNRTQLEKDFGVQVDSLADLVAFGVLPVCIGNAMLKVSIKFADRPYVDHVSEKFYWYPIFFWVIALFYVVAAMIRLAYFNATEDERKKEAEETGRSSYTGLPVTSASLIFPLILLFHFVFKFDFSLVYHIVMLAVGFLFLGKFHIKKPTMRGVILLIGMGVLEFIVLILLNHLKS